MSSAARAGGAGGPGMAIALGAVLDGIPESLVLGIGLAVGGSVNVGFLVAVLVSNVPESLSSTAELKASWPAGRVYRLWLGIGIAAAAAGAIGFALASQLPSLDGRYVQALAAGGVLTMLADTMMPVAFEQGGRPAALLTPLGFAVAAVLSLV